MPKIHGWVYGLNNGLLKELLTIEANPDNVPEAFRYNESEL